MRPTELLASALLFGLALTALSSSPASAWKVPPPGEHPRLVFNKSDLPVLRARLETARGRHLFEAVRSVADNWVIHPNSEVNKQRKALETEKAAAAAGGPPVKIVHNGPYGAAIGIAENAALIYAVTGDEHYGQAARDVLVTFIPYADGSGLRGAALVYDWVYDLLSEDERELCRTHFARMIEAKLKGVYEAPFALGPPSEEVVPMAIYWGMLEGAYAGIGALAIEGEPGFRQKWLDDSKAVTFKSLNRFLDPEGYHENGPSYTDYGFSNSNFWLEALRLRGTDWSKHPRLSKLPIWLTYLTLPGAIGVAPQLLPVGNSNYGTLTGQDGICWLYHAMPNNPWMSLIYDFNMSPAYFNGYIRTVGALFLWDQPLLPAPDPETLPRTKWFPDGGVFMRTGWGFQDCAFWLKTQQYLYTTGNHNDFGSFYLHAYGEPFAVEAMGKVVSSETHNLVFIDGKGMDHASYDIMPRTPLLDLVAGEFASAAQVDQKEAYSDDTFFEGPDRHLITKPLNPVEKAQRIGVTVWGGQYQGPYFLIVDDIDKDGAEHAYQWRMMVNPNHRADPKPNHITLTRDKHPDETWYPPLMDCQLLNPGAKLAYESQTEGEKTTGRLTATVQTINPHFTAVLYPRRPGQPTVQGMYELNATTETAATGHAGILRWAECVDRVVVAYGEEVEIADIRTDAKLAVIRTALPAFESGEDWGPVLGVLLVGGTRLTVDGRSLVQATGGPATLSAQVPQGLVALGTNTDSKRLKLSFPVKKYTRYAN